MSISNNIVINRASKINALIFGILSGIGGLTHGVGEILQGNIAPEGIWIYSWTQGPIASNMGGEPAITVIPNLLATGIITMLVSLCIIVWSLFFLEKRNAGRITIILSLILLFVGGGVGPPIIGLLAGIAGLGVRSSLMWWRKHLSDGLKVVLEVLWQYIFVIAAVNGVFLVIGSIILVYLFNMNNPDLFVNSFFLSIIFLIILNITGRAYDIRRH